MLVGSVDSTDVVNVDPTIAVLVHLLENLSDQLFTIRVHWTPDGTNELIELNKTTAIEVEVAEELLSLTLGEAKHVVSDGLGELVLVKGSRVVVIHNFELSLKSDKSSGATRNKFLSKDLGKFLWASVSGFTLWSTSWSSIESSSELVVVKSTTAINVIDGEKRLQVL